MIGSSAEVCPEPLTCSLRANFPSSSSWATSVSTAGAGPPTVVMPGPAYTAGSTP